MISYDILCLAVCMFAVFGGYTALRIIAHAALKRLRRRADQGCECAACPEAEKCPDAAQCPENGTSVDETPAQGTDRT